MRRRQPRRLRRLVEALSPYRPERVYLFGSWASRDADELSDIDFVVIRSTPAPFFERLREVAKLLPFDLGAVDILVYTLEEFADMKVNGNAFAEMVEAEGVILYETTRA
jgi:predicted nucleotidyltransferase